MEQILSTIMSSLVIPIILAFCGGIVYLVKKYVDRITTSIEAKNEIEKVTTTNKLKQQLLDEIEKVVNTAVATNMPKADKYKEGGNKLTEDQIKELNESARNLALAMLPNSITEENGFLLGVIGTKEKLNVLIDSYIEKATYDYKLKKK